MKIRFLIEFIREAEIKKAVWVCDGLKVPRSDEFNLNFIESFWETIKTDIVEYVYRFWECEEMFRGVNNIFVILIFKVQNI